MSDEPKRRIVEATEGMVALGQYKLRDNGVVRYPSVAADLNDVDSSCSFEAYVDQESGAVVYLPED